MEEGKRFGLSPELIKEIINLISSCNSIEKAVMFGSRSKKSYRNSSDIDLAVYGKEIARKDLNLLEDKLDQLNTSLDFDLVHVESLTKIELKNNIEKDGVEIYVRPKTKGKI